MAKQNVRTTHNTVLLITSHGIHVFEDAVRFGSRNSTRSILLQHGTTTVKELHGRISRMGH